MSWIWYTFNPKEFYRYSWGERRWIFQGYRLVPVKP